MRRTHNGALGLSSVIPSTPGYIGVCQFIAIAVLVPFGFSRADALAYILISQIVNYTLVGILGLIGLYKTNANWQRQRKNAHPG